MYNIPSVFWLVPVASIVSLGMALYFFLQMKGADEGTVMGWNSPMLPCEMYSPRAPIAVSCGKSTGDRLRSSAAVSIPTKRPEAADST